MWEYLSQGTATASTPIPEALAYGKLVAIIGTLRTASTSLRTSRNLEEEL